MREKLQQLIELQKVDVEIASVRKASDVYPKQIGELEKELASVRSALEAERAKMLDADRQKRTLEQNIQDEKEKVKKWEARLTEQRSTREYAALAREIDIAKKANLTMAEELVELTKGVAAQKDALKVKEQEIIGKAEEIAAKISALREKSEATEGQVKGLDARRTEVAKKVDGPLLSRYENVKRKKLPAVVPAVTGGTCDGCRMRLPPQLYNNLRVSLGTDLCPSCNRVIYASEALELPKANG